LILAATCFGERRFGAFLASTRAGLRAGLDATLRAALARVCFALAGLLSDFFLATVTFFLANALDFVGLLLLAMSDLEGGDAAPKNV
jgi:hypothetical protein